MTDILFAVAAGIPATIVTTAVSFLLGLTLSLPLILLQRTQIPLLGWLIRRLIDLIRAIPVLVWIFILYYGITIGQFALDPFSAGIVALGVVSAAHLAEVGRTALEAIPRHQWEAARALGLSRPDTFWRVIIPQAIRIAIPSGTSFLLVLLKDSSIPSVIGVGEIAFHTTKVARSSGEPLVAFAAAVICYLLLSVPIGLLSRRGAVKVEVR